MLKKGKIEPKLLKCASNKNSIATKKSSFDYHKSNITSYAFSDEGNIVKIYIELKGIGDKCDNDNDIHLDYTNNSFQLTIKNYDQELDERCLCFSKLYDDIDSASLRKRKDKIIISLTKKKKEVEEGDENDENVKEVKDWPCIGAVDVPSK